MNSLEKVYNQQQEEETYQKFHQVVFKLDVMLNGSKVLDDDQLVNYLKTLQIMDWNPFLNKIGLIVENYDVGFMTNPAGRYFVKLSIVYPSINTILEFKNSQCLHPECNSKILNYWCCFCEGHNSDQALTEDAKLVSEYFDHRSEELKHLYESYQKQEDLVHYLKTQITTPQLNLKSPHLGDNVECELNIVYNTGHLVDIEFEDDDELDRYLFGFVSENDSGDDSDTELQDILCPSIASESEIQSTKLELESELEQEVELELEIETEPELELELELEQEPEILKPNLRLHQEPILHLDVDLDMHEGLDPKYLRPVTPEESDWSDNESIKEETDAEPETEADNIFNSFASDSDSELSSDSDDDFNISKEELEEMIAELTNFNRENNKKMN